MITSYLISHNLPRPMGWLTPLPLPIESYPMLTFPLNQPRDFQYLFMCGTIIIMNQNNKRIRITLKN